ncbi:MAG: hypothetical protein KatS3mg022_1873 [Armatimonadota bacterium]|nr:MAG: hypothetical protein KatS3mg022_1873 [Armatimonadota bacterium]
MGNFKVLEGTWEEIKAHESELKGHRLRVMVLPETGDTEFPLTGRELLHYLASIGFIGEWADRTDITDSGEYVRQLRQQIETLRG